MAALIHRPQWRSGIALMGVPSPPGSDGDGEVGTAVMAQEPPLMPAVVRAPAETFHFCSTLS
jgi:hypothetical protein